jgi:phage protein U
MLMCIGAVVVDVYPLNFENVDRKGTASFAEKSVVGRRPILEAVGEGEETFELSGKMFPQKLGGLGSLELLRSQMAAQEALPFMRGDGTPLGWVVITDVQDKSRHLNPDGVGRMIEVSVSLKRSDPAGVGGGIVGLLFGLFG